MKAIFEEYGDLILQILGGLGLLLLVVDLLRPDGMLRELIEMFIESAC